VPHTDGKIFIKDPKGDLHEPPKLFNFDSVYDFNSTQEQVYQNTAYPIIQSVLEGYNGTIFAYGQTGAGKTYTMIGALELQDHKGIIPRAIDHIFNYISTSSTKEFLVRVSMFDIYREEIRDLLAPDGEKNLKIIEKPDTGIYIQDLIAFAINDVKKMHEALALGRKNRAIRQTKMGESSSRLSCVYSIVVETGEISSDGLNTIKMGKLNLIDLCGSEKLSTNQSSIQPLTTLRKVICALTESKVSHVPYRDSKLTRYLQNSLG